MNVAAQVLAVLEGITLIAVGVGEAFFYGHPRFRSLFRVKPEDAAAIRLWATNVGFYNMVFGLAVLVGVVTLNTGYPVVGRTLIFMVCISQFVGGIVLAFVEPKMWRTAVFQGSLPLLIIVVALFF